MASNNMQFTVQASAMMSMCYIYVRAMKFKERSQVFSTRISIRKAPSRRVELHFQDETDTTSLWSVYGINIILCQRKTLTKHMEQLHVMFW